MQTDLGVRLRNPQVAAAGATVAGGLLMLMQGVLATVTVASWITSGIYPESSRWVDIGVAVIWMVVAVMVVVVGRRFARLGHVGLTWMLVAVAIVGVISFYVPQIGADHSPGG